MTEMIESLKAEYLRYKALAEAAFNQVNDEELSVSGSHAGNSLAILCWHLFGNFRSRFTDFLTADGEKSWRDRDEEFAPRAVSRAEFLAKWEDGWAAVLGALASLTDEQLKQTVTIRGQTLQVHEALFRSLAHTSYHVGQMVFLAKSLRGDEWRYLSIPPGGSKAYNSNPTSEHAAAHATKLQDVPDAKRNG